MFDPGCLALAEQFLSSRLTEKRAKELSPVLAQHIQDEIESWLDGELEEITYKENLGGNKQ